MRQPFPWILSVLSLSLGCYTGVDPGADGDGGQTDGEAETDGGDEGIDTAPPALGCADARTLFEDYVYPQVIAPHCLGCHSEGGMAWSSALSLRLDADLDHLAHDWDVIEPLARSGMLRAKPSGGSPHGGGALLAEGSEELELLDLLIEQLQDGNADACEPFDGLALTEGFVLEPEQVSLTRAKLAITGTHPTTAELELLEAEGYDATIDASMPEWILSEGFLDPHSGALSAVMDEHFGLKGMYRSRGFQKTCIDMDGQYQHTKKEKKVDGMPVSNAQGSYVASYIRTDDVSEAVGAGGNALASTLVKEGRPFTDLVLADFMMVSEESGRLYFPPPGWTADQTSHPADFSPPSIDAMTTEFDPELGFGKAKPLSTGRPHVGLLGSDLMLCKCRAALGSMDFPKGAPGHNRYRISEQNNYRRTANCVAQDFLGVDLFDFGAQLPAVDAPDGDDHPARLTDCQSCHDHIEELTPFFTDYDERGHYIPDFGHAFVTIPVEDGHGPAFLGEALPSGESHPLRWLGERVAAHPRFATTMTARLFFPIVMGRPALPAPRDPNIEDYLAESRRARIDEAVSEAAARIFIDGGYQVAPVMAALVKSRLFRAAAVEDGVDEATAAVLERSGTARLMPPATLHRFIESTFGQPWLAPYKNVAMAPGLVDHRLDWRTLAGGLDGWSVTERPRGAPTALNVSTLEHVAISMACQTVPDQLQSRDDAQVLLPLVDASTPSDAPEFQRTLEVLFERFTGRPAPATELDAMSQLFDAARLTSGPACDTEEPAVRGWVAVVVYLFTHSNTLVR